MEYPLQRAAARIRQVDFAGTLQRNAGWDAGNRRFYRIELQLGIGPRSEHDFPVHGSLRFRKLELRLPLAQEVPRMIHGTDVGNLHRRMSRHRWPPSLRESGRT